MFFRISKIQMDVGCKKKEEKLEIEHFWKLVKNHIFVNGTARRSKAKVRNLVKFFVFHYLEQFRGLRLERTPPPPSKRKERSPIIGFSLLLRSGTDRNASAKLSFIFIYFFFFTRFISTSINYKKNEKSETRVLWDLPWTICI